jgi:DNA-binding transcriptional regulator LsrR (DeoR family)
MLGFSGAAGRVGQEPRAVRRAVMRLIQNAGGTLNGTQRALAIQLDLSQPVLNRALAEGKAAGLISVDASRLAGTKVKTLAA